jgi:hypothetical protein
MNFIFNFYNALTSFGRSHLLYHGPGEFESTEGVDS